MPRRVRPSAELLEARALLAIPGLVTALTTDRDVYGPGQPVHMTFTATNASNHPVSFADNAQATDFTVGAAGKTFWDEDFGQFIPAITVVQTLAPGQSFTLTATWNGSPDPGASAPKAGPLQVRCLVDLGLAKTITIAPTPPPAYATPIPISPLEGGPFGGNPAFAADDQVDGLYQMILGREPDPTGRMNAVNAVKAGVPLANLAAGLIHSTEYERSAVVADYWDYLGRAGTPNEIQGWVALMQAGMTQEQVQARFLESFAFSALHADTDDFIQSVYEDGLGRPASAFEVSTLKADGASRAAIVDAVLGSTEAEAKAVEGLYGSILGRRADATALANAVPALKSGAVTIEGLAAYLLGAPEFKARVGVTSA